MAKVAKILVSKEILEKFLKADMFNDPKYVIASDAPKDLEIIGLAIPGFTNAGYPTCFEVYARSEAFADTKEGEEPPTVKFLYTQTYLDNG